MGMNTLLLLAAATTAHAFGPGPYPYRIPAQPVFPPDLAGVPCYRIPSIVQTAQGSLVAFAETRYGSHWNQPGFCADAAQREIATRRSTDGGMTWSEVAIVVGNSSYRVANPQALATKTNSGNQILLLYALVSRFDTGNITLNGMMTSVDDGKTWSEPREVNVYVHTRSRERERERVRGPHVRMLCAVCRVLCTVRCGEGCTMRYTIHTHTLTHFILLQVRAPRECFPRPQHSARAVTVQA